MNKSKKDINIERVGAGIYYTYRIFKLIVFLLNIFVIYKCINDEPKFLVLSLILNIIYILIYIRRFSFILIAGVVSFYFFNDIFKAICLGFAIGNGISYVIDFIRIVVISFIIRIMQASARK